MPVTTLKKKSKLPKSDSVSVFKYGNLPGKRAKEPADPVIIGRFARPVGIQGELKVRAENIDASLILELKTLTVRFKNGFRQFDVLKTSQVGASFRFLLADIDSRDSAGLLTGCEIVIAASEVPALPDSEYYIDDLTGCMVVTDENEELGFLREVWQQGHHDVWVVDGQSGEILIPAVKDLVLNVDLLNHRITIRNVEGLWAED